MTEENTPEEAPKPKKKINWITIVFVTVGIIALGAAIMIPQSNTYCCGGRAYDSDAKSHLHNVFLACKAYWADHGSESNCTPAIAAQPEYGYVQTKNVTIYGSGTENDFSATAQNTDSEKTFRVDFNGTITEEMD